MVDRKNFLRRKYDPATRERLERSIEEARAVGNDIFANQLQEELDSLGKPSGLAFRTSIAAQKRTSESDQQERLAQLNIDNRRRNNEAVRRAQIQERQRAREADQKVGAGKLVSENASPLPGAKAKSVSEVDGTPGRSGSGASTPAANGTPAGSQRGVLVPEVARLREQKYAENTGIPTIRKPIMDDDIIASLDMDIDVEIE